MCQTMALSKIQIQQTDVRIASILSPNFQPKSEAYFPKCQTFDFSEPLLTDNYIVTLLENILCDILMVCIVRIETVQDNMR